MLRFFRILRKKLIDDGHIRKYFWYALGEILLVVIGILIALQINNWNEKRKLHASEQEIIAALTIEFESNLSLLYQAIDELEFNMDQVRNLGEFTGPETPDFNEADISDLMVLIFKYSTNYEPYTGTIDEVINSGKLSIIENQNIRSGLSMFKSDLTRLELQEEYVMNEQFLAHQYFLENGNFRRHLVLINEGYVAKNEGRFGPNKFEFLTNQAFESRLYMYAAGATNLKDNFYLPLKSDIESLIQLLKEAQN